MNQSPQRWPIDDYFDEEFASRLAKLESHNKHIYRPNTYLHKWWARRCGTTFRLILKQLVSNPSKANFYTGGGLAGKVIMDPMMGGGTTLHEAIRLGASVIGIDIDPIPVLQARATLSKVELELLDQRYVELHHRLSKELRPLFQTLCRECNRTLDLQFMLYGLRKRCECQEVIVLDSLVLRTEPDRTLTVICPRCHHVDQEDQEHKCQSKKEHLPIITKDLRNCPSCISPFVEDLSSMFYSRYVPVAAACHCPEHGFQLSTITVSDLVLIEKADDRRGELLPEKQLDVRAGPKSAALLRKGVRNYEDLFSSRQIIYIKKAAAFTAACDDLIGLNLALLISTSLDMNAMLCGYKGTGTRRAGAVRHVFSHHAYSFPYTALENNPVYPSRVSGSLHRLFTDRIKRGKKWALQPMERSINEAKSKFVAVEGEVDLGHEVERGYEGLDFESLKLSESSRSVLLMQRSAAETMLPQGSVDFVVTDPPYYDSVQYEDLAAFFRVWLEQLLPANSQKDISWDYLVTAAAVGSDTQKQNDILSSAYLTNLSGIFGECQRLLRPQEGRLIFTYHHWKAVAWAALTVALKESSFILLNYYVVHSENPMSVHIANLNSINHDAVLVLAPGSGGLTKKWPQPKTVDFSDSQTFCGSCAQILGALLDSKHSDKEIVSIWERLLG